MPLTPFQKAGLRQHIHNASQILDDSGAPAIGGSGAVDAAIAAHVASSDPHPTYDTAAEVQAALDALGALTNPITYIDATDAAAPGNPSAGRHRLYSKSDGIYYRDSAGVEKGPLGAGGTPGGTFPPLYDHAAKRNCYVYGSGAYNNGDFASDYWEGNAAAATTASMPQDAEYDLGDNPPSIGSSRMFFNDSSHRSASGSLDWSDDRSSWTSVATWSGETLIDRYYVFAPVQHRYWRIHTTAAGSGGSGIDIKTWALFSSGRNVAQGATITALGSMGVGSLANATDGRYDTKANATSQPGYPNWYRIDLGSALAIIGAHVLFGDAGHCAVNGALQSSTDDSTWTDRVVWTNQKAYERYLPLAAPITARYWRLTATAIPGNAGLDVTEFELAAAT